MGFAKPVVATDCEPLRRLIAENDCGLTFRSGDVADFTRALKELMRDRLKDVKGRNGRAAIERKYNWEIDGSVFLDTIHTIGKRTTELASHADVLSKQTVPAEACSLGRDRTMSAELGIAGAASDVHPTVLMLDLCSMVPYYAASLCKALAEEGVDVTLGSIAYQYDPACFKREGVRCDPGLLDFVTTWGASGIFLRRILKFLEYLINLTAFAVRMAASKPDVVHVQFIPLIQARLPFKARLPFELWFLQFARRLGARLVYTVHNELPTGTGDRHFRTFEEVYRKMDLLICHTPRIRARVMERFGVAEDRIRVIPHGPLFQNVHRHSSSEARSLLGLGPDEYIVLWQGWLKPYKGISFLLDAWRNVQSRLPLARLIIAGSGEGNLVRDMQRQVARLGISGSVRLESCFMPVEEVSLYHEAADVLVYPYTEVTTSGALMTGVNFGKAIVATDLPAFHQILEHGRSALLFPPNDSAALADAIEHLFHDPQLRDKLSREAESIATSRQNSWSTIARLTRESYESLLVGQGRTFDHAQS
jgi:glycosyltransferase involved in cell wall biosynthesis